MSALAKAVAAFNEQHVVAQYGGDVWLPEKVYEKWVELARRELQPEEKAALAQLGKTARGEGSR